MKLQESINYLRMEVSKLLNLHVSQNYQVFEVVYVGQSNQNNHLVQYYLFQPFFELDAECSGSQAKI